MKAIVVQGKPDDPQLVWAEVPDAAEAGLAPQEVVVAVAATAVNRADLSQARGNYPPPPGASEILGLEMAGVITAVGDQVSEWQPGERVAALLPGGGYAEQVVVHQGLLLPLPDAWTFDMGTAVPEVWLTAYVNLFLEGALQTGESVLIHAGGSGVGTAAIQLAVAAGARVFITAGAPEKLATGRDLGAELAVNYKENDFLEPVLATTGQEGVDLILDPVGGAYLERNVKALRRFGRLVNIGLLGGSSGQLDMALLLRKRLRLVGSTLRTRPLEEKIEITRQFRTRFWPQLVAGTLRPIIDSTFPIEQAQAAHAYVQQNRNTGKVILQVK